MSDDVFRRLREFLDGFPGGYPSTASGVEIKVLRKLFTADEAEMALCLRQRPEPVAAIAGRRGMEEAEAAEMLENMARKGLIFRVRFDEQPLYMALQFVVGIYEFQLQAMDRELAEMVEEYLPYFETVPRQVRVIPVNSALETTSAVAKIGRAHV